MVSIKSKAFEVVCCQSVMSKLIVRPGQVLLWRYLVEEVNHSRALRVCVCVQCLCVCVVTFVIKIVCKILRTLLNPKTDP